MSKVIIYDTTLRDGTQSEDISLLVEDKVKIALKLDSVGVDYIEGGWPGANPKDIDFFREIRKHKLTHSKITAFGMTRRASNSCDKDANLKGLIASKADVFSNGRKQHSNHCKSEIAFLEYSMEL